MTTYTIAPLTISQPIFVPTGAIVTVTPDAGATAVVEYTQANAAAVQNGIATWSAWRLGSATVATSDLLGDASYVRVKATVGAVTLDINESPTADMLITYRTDWGPPAAGGSAMTTKDEGVTLSAATTSIDFVGAGVVATNTGGAVTVTIAGGGTTTVTPVVAPGATPSINTDVTDIAVFSGLAVAITSMTTNLTGTPVDGETLEVHHKDNGTPRVIAWGAKFVDGAITLPTTTVAGTRLRTYLQWDALLATPAWVCVGRSY